MLPETFEPLPPEFEALVGRRPDLQRLRFSTVCDLGSADVEATLLAAAFVVRGGHLSKWRKGGRAGTHDRFIKVASKDGGAAGAVLLWESKRGEVIARRSSGSGRGTILTARHSSQTHAATGIAPRPMPSISAPRCAPTKQLAPGPQPLSISAIASPQA